MQLDTNFNSDGSSESPKVSSGNTAFGETKISVDLLQSSDDFSLAHVVRLVLV